jgi:hypothetical protein
MLAVPVHFSLLQKGRLCFPPCGFAYPRRHKLDFKGQLASGVIKQQGFCTFDAESPPSGASLLAGSTQVEWDANRINNLSMGSQLRTSYLRHRACGLWMTFSFSLPMLLSCFRALPIRSELSSAARAAEKTSRRPLRGCLPSQLQQRVHCAVNRGSSRACLASIERVACPNQEVYQCHSL